MQPWARHQRSQPLPEPSGDIIKQMMPSRQWVFGLSTTCPVALV